MVAVRLPPKEEGSRAERGGEAGVGAEEVSAAVEDTRRDEVDPAAVVVVTAMVVVAVLGLEERLGGSETPKLSLEKREKSACAKDDVEGAPEPTGWDCVWRTRPPAGLRKASSAIDRGWGADR